MEFKYIFAIVALSLFCLLMLIYFALLVHRRSAEAKLSNWLYERYCVKNSFKKDYDSLSPEEEAVIEAARLASEAHSSSGKTDEDVQLRLEDAYGKIEVEGIEEITGTYNGEW